MEKEKFLQLATPAPLLLNPLPRINDRLGVLSQGERIWEWRVLGQEQPSQGWNKRAPSPSVNPSPGPGTCWDFAGAVRALPPAPPEPRSGVSPSCVPASPGPQPGATRRAEPCCAVLCHAVSARPAAAPAPSSRVARLPASAAADFPGAAAAAAGPGAAAPASGRAAAGEKPILTGCDKLFRLSAS